MYRCKKLHKGLFRLLYKNYKKAFLTKKDQCKKFYL